MTKKAKTLFAFLLLAGLILACETIYARAGGGGGGGGGGSGGHGGSRGPGGIIALVIWAIYTAIVSTILFFKTSKSDLILRWAYKNDKIWDGTRMKALAKSIFFKMQEAWMNRDIDSVKEFISAGLYNDYKEQLGVMRSNGEKNILESIYVSDVMIISCEDYIDDAKDSFIAYIKGSILDYTINEDTNEVIKNKKKEQEKFIDTYHFIRKENKWVLNDIDNDVTIGDLMRTVNYIEK